MQKFKQASTSHSFNKTNQYIITTIVMNKMLLLCLKDLHFKIKWDSQPSASVFFVVPVSIEAKQTMPGTVLEQDSVPRWCLTSSQSVLLVWCSYCYSVFYPRSFVVSLMQCSADDIKPIKRYIVSYIAFSTENM